MAATPEELTEQVMALPPDARARLAALLVESLDTEVLDAVDRLWLAEATRRRDAVRGGHVQTIPGEEALQSVRDALR
jgi:putative addiction module component